MKKILACLIVAAMLCVLAACGNEPSIDVPNDTTVASQEIVRTPDEWVDYLSEQASFEDIMQVVDGDAAISRYGVDEGYAGPCRMYISTMATPEEITVFQTDANHSAEYFTGLAQQYLAQQKDSYSSYAPEQLPKLDSAVVRTCGDCVIICVTADNAQIASLLDA